VGEPVTIASCAFFGVRQNRDAEGYYRLLLNDLARKKGAARMVVATNEPAGFDSSIEILHVPDFDLYRRRIWDCEDFESKVVDLFSWSWRNSRLEVCRMPRLVSIYLAKTAICCEMAREAGKVVWLDAGLLFSAVYGHQVPRSWQGYSQARLAEKLQPFAADRSAEFIIFPRRCQIFKNKRPHFHGLSYDDMSQLARSAGTRPDKFYTAAGAMVLDASAAALMEAELPNLWRLVTDMGKCSTEENILSLFRWRHGVPGRTQAEWMDLLTDVPPEQFVRDR